jgi:hypothetical protein
MSESRASAGVLMPTFTQRTRLLPKFCHYRIGFFVRDCESLIT